MEPSEDEGPAGGKLRADAVLVAVTVVWGSSYVVMRRALETAPPFALIFWRFATALALAAAAVAILRRRRPAGLLRDGTVLGTLLAAGQSLQVLGQAETTATKAAFLTGLAVVLTPFVAVFRTKRLPTLENGLGIALASVGFLLLTFPGRGGVFQRGDLWVAAGSVLFAFYGVELAERAGKHDALWLTIVQLSFVVALAAGLALALRAAPLSATHVGSLEARPIPWSGGFPWTVAYLGSVCTLAGFLGWTWSQGRMSAIHGAIILALEPVWASLLAAWLLGERAGGRGVAGAALVLAGIVVSELRLRARRNG
jgi:drug/metabolite transporter (DMT)-like permease